MFPGGKTGLQFPSSGFPGCRDRCPSHPRRPTAAVLLPLDKIHRLGTTAKNAGLDVTQPSRAKPGSATGIPERGQRGDDAGMAPDPAGAEGMEGPAEGHHGKDRCPLPICTNPIENRQIELLCIERYANPGFSEYLLHTASMPEKYTAAW